MRKKVTCALPLSAVGSFLSQVSSESQLGHSNYFLAKQHYHCLDGAGPTLAENELETASTIPITPIHHTSYTRNKQCTGLPTDNPSPAGFCAPSARHKKRI
ncbi:hypothetical protein B0T24DRAFT_143886 [Lasiosphaeria ovina]|uniref:Uncharacterized protein n=1 Tax=Lasiosphaeria ovina TaxID=92902 RepID=A0AAE0ND35_9PEZI|nr:hypothetical protein B0T24DRAFT_143886 [Lasiosphaeria ovina]